MHRGRIAEDRGHALAATGQRREFWMNALRLAGHCQFMNLAREVAWKLPQADHDRSGLCDPNGCRAARDWCQWGKVASAHQRNLPNLSLL